MAKMWAGRFEKELNEIADDFNSSLRFDKRMYAEDITGSMAHAAMLGAKGIIEQEAADKIIAELENILNDINSGKIEITDGEDIHMFVESVLTERLGEVGKKLHTARSRNDQVAVDLRLYMRNATNEIINKVYGLLGVLAGIAEEHKETILPGYTHLQRAQPITFGHHIMAYAMMFTRDIDRLKDAVKRMNISPLGSCALAGTTYDTDRFMVAEKLGFDGVSQNSIDGVSDRDFCIELCSAFSTLMMHLSRFSEEIILWTSWEFRFVTLSDEFSTGSSIMPQKKNSDMAELVRGKTGRVYGDLITLLTMLKGLPLAYNKDMQEDKEAIFDAVDTVSMCLDVFTPMLETMTVNKENMKTAAAKGFINATDVADYLVKKGMAFRTAYKITGQLVAKCIHENKVLETLTLDEYKEFSDTFDSDLYDEISLESCVKKRISFGGTSPESVKTQIEYIRDFIKKA